jgi:uncharacterized OsmC-like protein
MAEEKTFSVSLELLENYLFKIDFGAFGDLITDELEPLGNGEGPNPALLLAASVANCLAASITFAIRKFKEEPGKVTATVTGTIARIDGRLRIEKMQVRLQLGNTAENIPHIQRVLEKFEDYCIVTQSVRQGIEVNLEVLDANGTVLTTD